jgi:hypothetical protein
LGVMSDTAARIAVKRSATLGGEAVSIGWEGLASLGLDASASKRDAPKAPRGRSAASALESRCWFDIFSP